jgi:hypothetical protein
MRILLAFGDKAKFAKKQASLLKMRACERFQ